MDFLEHEVLLAVFCEPEIPNFPLVSEPHDVGRLEIPVDDALGHEGLVPVHHLFHYQNSPILGNALLQLDQLLQIPVRAVLGDKVVDPGGLDHIDALHDVGVIQGHQRLDFHLE